MNILVASKLAVSFMVAPAEVLAKEVDIAQIIITEEENPMGMDAAEISLPFMLLLSLPP